MKINEQSISDDLISSIGKQVGSLGLYGQSKNAGMEISQQMSSLKRNLKKNEMTEDETNEMTGTGSSGGYSQPLFSVTKKEVEEITKIEATEATSSSSSGSYVTPAAWAKSTKKKDWRGKSKTQIPGGQFVQVKKKCKKFPYCNQGDINALKFTNETTYDRVIKIISEKYELKESIVRDILLKHYRIK